MLEPTPFTETQRPSKRPDWGPVKIDYELGVLKKGDIAKKHDMLLSSLSNKAKRDGWVRPGKQTTKAVYAALRKTAEFVAEKAAKKVKTASQYKPRPYVPAMLISNKVLENKTEALQAVMRRTADVLLQHRSDIVQLSELSAGQLRELRLATVNPELLFATVDQCEAKGVIDDAESQLLRRELRGICDLKGRMVALTVLTKQYSELQAMEREAFGIEDGGTPEAENDDIGRLLVEFVSAPGGSSP